MRLFFLAMSILPTHHAVPPQPPAHVVVAGDSLWKIGEEVNRTWPQLAAYNHVPNPDLIYVGQVVRIPPANYVAPVVVEQPVRRVTEQQPVYRSEPQVQTQQRVTYTPTPPVEQTSNDGVWSCIAEHESGGNPTTDTGNGYYGAFQFTLGSWQAAGGSGNPANASYAEQLSRAERLQSIVGWGAWPNTSRMCGV
jgi:LysM repeat protein